LKSHRHIFTFFGYNGTLFALEPYIYILLMNNKFSPGFSQALLFSREEAMRLHSKIITNEHLLLGLLRDRLNEAVKIIKGYCSDLDEIKRAIEEKMPQNPSDTNLNPEDLTIDATAQKALKTASNLAFELNETTIGSKHLLIAILQQKESIATRILAEKGILSENILNQTISKSEMFKPIDSNNPKLFPEDCFIEPRPIFKSNSDSDDPKMFKSNFDSDEDEEDEIKSENKSRPRSFKVKDKDLDNSDTPYLDRFGIDITAAAQEEALDPVVGRNDEIERIAQILSRRKKNNPILIGAPGVGKTAIVEGLAQRIVKKNVPAVLMNKRIFALSMTSLVAGTKYRGQFEERIQGLLDELSGHKEVILFIDEIHTMVGAGATPGSMDAANILKPALSRGNLQCIGSTTTDEYRKTIEKDGALERRFQKIMVEPTTPDETLQILHNIKDRYETHHCVTYTDEALEACVRLTDRYVTERQLPDKAIDAMDEAGSRVHIMNVGIPPHIEEAERNLKLLGEKKMKAVQSEDFGLAAQLRDEEIGKKSELQQMQKEWQESLQNKQIAIGRSEVEETVSMMSGVPVQRIMATETIRLKGLKDNLMHEVIAQDKAIEKLVKAITRNRIGLRDPNKPIGTFMFLGPTGVGKTYLAKELAKYMFGSSDALIRIDMSEYMEKFSTSRLVGAPPGYVGYDEGGQLTEKVRRHPYSIVLLDEIEKANKDVFNILLQVMDEGRLTDNNGSTVNFKNTVIIITSNCGTRQVYEFGRGIGFGEALTTEQRNSQNQEIIEKALKKEFAPEFLNRIDEIITFDPLSREAIGRIADLEIQKLNMRIKNIEHQITIDNEAREFIIDKGYDKTYGARPLKRAIQTYLEDGLADFLLGNEGQEDETIHIGFDKEKQVLTFQ